MSLQMHRFHQFHISLSAGLFLCSSAATYIAVLLRLTVFTKDSIKEDECSGYGAAVLVYAFVCLCFCLFCVCAWHSWFNPCAALDF